MAGSAAELRQKLERVGRVKRASTDEDTRRHLQLDPGERLLATLRHCDAHLSATPAHALERVPDSEVEVWQRVRRRLAASG
jgi:hypothetical protein